MHQFRDRDDFIFAEFHTLNYRNNHRLFIFGGLDTHAIT